MGTEYKELYNSVYSKIKDYDLADISEEEADEIIHDHLRPAIVMFECCNQDLTDRGDTAFNFTLSDINFEILSNYMVICYLDSTYIRTSEKLKTHMSTTDFHKFDNKDVLSKAIEVRSMYAKENRQLVINYSLHGDDTLFAKTYRDKGAYDINKYSKVKKRRCCK